MRLAGIWLLLLASACVAARPKPAVPIIDQAALANAGLTLFWEARLPVDSGESLKEAFLRDEALYVTTDRGALFAVHAETGLLRWGDKLTEAAYRIYAPTHFERPDGKGNVVIPTTTRIIVRDRFSGRDVTQFTPDFPISSPVAAYDATILMGATNGNFYSFVVNPRISPDPIMRWQVATGGPVLATPILFGPRHRDLVIASRSGSVFSCSAPDKALHWHFPAADAIVTDVAVDAGGVYVPCLDRSLYKLNAETGSQNWRVLFPSPLSTPPTVAAQTVYQFCDGEGVSALDSITGVLKWRLPDADTFVAHSSAGDILFSASGRLWIAEHENGEVLAEVGVPRVRSSMANAASDAAYLLADEGRVFCLRLDKVPYLKRQQVLAARRQLNLPPPDASREPTIGSTSGTGPVRAADDPFRSRHDAPPPGSP